jgi:hypothetical protein
MRLKSIILCLPMLFIGLNVAVASENKYTGKYENYVFTPEYGEANGADMLPFYGKLQAQLQPWWVPNIYAAMDIGGASVFMYKTGFQKDKYVEFDNMWEKKWEENKNPGPRTWEAIEVYRNETHKELIRVEKRSLLPGPYRDYDPYGCAGVKPLFKTALAEHKEYLWVITGAGWRSDSGKDPFHEDYLMLHLYEPQQFTQDFALPLLAFNFRTDGVSPTDKYQFGSATYGRKEPLKTQNVVIVPNDPDRGIKLYSKMFVKDFNKNDRLDILIWQREYGSRRRDETGKDWKLISNRFEWYEEANDGSHFTEKPISEVQGTAWLKQYELNWKDGYPRPEDNQCTGGMKAIPFINTTDDPVIRQTH